MVKTAWYDIDSRGRRLNAIVKHMNTLFWDNIRSDDPDKQDLALSYLDKMIILEKTIQPYVEQVMGIKKFLRKNERNLPVTVS